MDLTPKQQTSEAIRQAETILITTGQRPNVDQVAAVLALAAILRKFGKKVSAVISDPLPQAVQFLDATTVDKKLSGLRDFILKVDVTRAKADKLRYEIQDGKLNVYITPHHGGFAPSDVTFAQVRLQPQRDLGLGSRLCFPGIDWFVKMKNSRAGGTESGVGQSKVRIELYRFRIQIFRAVEVLEQGIGSFLDRNST